MTTIKLIIELIKLVICVNFNTTTKAQREAKTRARIWMCPRDHVATSLQHYTFVE
jgi:hypothetical protein